MVKEKDTTLHTPWLLSMGFWEVVFTSPLEKVPSSLAKEGSLDPSLELSSNIKKRCVFRIITKLAILFWLVSYFKKSRGWAVPISSLKASFTLSMILIPLIALNGLKSNMYRNIASSQPLMDHGEVLSAGNVLDQALIPTPTTSVEARLLLPVYHTLQAYLRRYLLLPDLLIAPPCWAPRLATL